MATVVPRAVEAVCISGDKKLKSSAGVVYAVVLAAGSAADATLILYDNTAAGGERELYLAAAQKTSISFCPSNVGIKFNTGIYADISGAGAYATIIYE